MTGVRTTRELLLFRELLGLVDLQQDMALAQGKQRLLNHLLDRALALRYHSIACILRCTDQEGAGSRPTP